MLHQTTARVAAKRAASPLPPSPVLRGALAENLRDARLAAGLTQRELAELTGLSRKYIGEIEGGIANVSIDLLAVLAQHVRRSPISLLSPKKAKT
jgi:transcriptional regulator with XRE-family HTH domain